MEKLTKFIESFGEVATVFNHFPLWYKIFFFSSALLFLIVGGMFIHFYSVTSLRLKTSNEFSALEKKALSGDSQSMTELSFSGDPKAFDVLASILQSNPQEKTREAAVIAISNLNDSRKVPLLGNTLVTEKWLVAAACAQALGRMKDKAAVPYLIRALEIKIDWVTAQKSAEALGFFEPTDAISKALVRTLSEGSFEGEAAMQSLVNHGKSSVPFLIDNLNKSDSSEGLELTIQALRLIGDKAAIPALQNFSTRIDALNTEDKDKRRLRSNVTNAIDELQKS